MKYFLLTASLLMSCFNLSAEAVLQATLTVASNSQRTDSSVENMGKIQPGSQIKLVATVQNTGTEPNAPGKISIRYIFPEPLSSQPNSMLFQTEWLTVPSITPGQEVVVNFPTDQNWPSLFEFIRHDWGMRQFQAIMPVDGTDKILGTLSVLFSAYYYQGPNKEIGTPVPVFKPEPKRELRLKPAVTRNAQRPAGSKQFAKQRAAATSAVAGAPTAAKTASVPTAAKAPAAASKATTAAVPAAKAATVPAVPETKAIAATDKELASK